MIKLFKSAALAAAATVGMLASGSATASPSFATASPASVQTGAESWQHSRHRDGYRGDRHYRGHRHYRSSRNYYQGRTWRGRDGRYYCRRSNGTTGLLIGGAAGALLGRAVDTRGERATGTILGAAGGALLGRSIDRNHSRCR
jgi:hypothetical protein